MKESQFIYTHIYHHLREEFKKFELPKQDKPALLEEMHILLSVLENAQYTVIIPPSQFDDTIKEILVEALGEIPEETPQGIVADIREVKYISDRLYALTSLGRIEHDLRECVIQELRSFLLDIDGYVKEKKIWEEGRYNEDLREYEDKMDSFVEGDYGYDWDGPIYPERPKAEYFSEEEISEMRKLELEHLNLDDPRVILDNVPIEDGLLGDMLHNYFISSESMEQLIADIDFDRLNKKHITYFLRTLDVYFLDDIDILQRGFLLGILKEIILEDFVERRPHINIHFYIETFFCVMEQDSACALLLENYNRAAASNDALEMQRLWYYLSSLYTIVIKEMNAPSFNIRDTSKLVVAAYSRLNKENQGKLEGLIKVFPSDEVTSLIYPGRNPPHPYYPHYDVELPLKPYFFTLELMARQTYELLTQGLKVNDGMAKTNIVSAMLCFVVSSEPEDFPHLTDSKKSKSFINIPLDFDYGSRLISVDEGFKNKDDLECSIGYDLELGMRVANREVTLPINKKAEAKDLMRRLISTLDLNSFKREELLSQIENADIEDKVTLSYLMSSDIQKSTEHHHSERVLNGALKKPENIQKIVFSMKQAILQKARPFKGIYTIYGAALLVYSYPNSICDGCGISFLALQNSYEKGFLAEFIKIANEEDKSHLIQLRTNGYDKGTGNQMRNEFGITVIAGSNKVFSKDVYATLITNRPESKLTCRRDSDKLARPGIDLQKSIRNKNRFFEFTAGSTIHQDEKLTVKYGGIMFMSGSKKSKLEKLSKDKQRVINARVDNFIKENRMDEAGPESAKGISMNSHH